MLFATFRCNVNMREKASESLKFGERLLDAFQFFINKRIIAH